MIADDYDRRVCALADELHCRLHELNALSMFPNQYIELRGTIEGLEIAMQIMVPDKAARDLLLADAATRH